MAQIRDVEAAEQLGLRMHICKYNSRVLQHQMNSILNKENTIGYKWLKYVNKKQHTSLAFRYNPAEDYSLNQHVLIGTMTVVCPYCKAPKFSGETKGMHCTAGKIKLPQLREPPEPLNAWLAGYTAESKHFLSYIRKYNSCFLMTSFGTEILTTHFLPTFKVKG
ncbi:uncharacterized protein TNCV_3372921 [Trichonephila clavipes]|nr:uncharacterized protein TNCV_3372921 [Trichonephila clavipes]